MRTKPPVSPARRAMKALCTILGVIFLVMLSTTLYFRHLMDQVHYIDSTPHLSQEALDQFYQSGGGGSEGSFSQSPVTIGGKGSGLINILLVGQDSRAGESGARSDSMILCTFQKSSKTLIMTSFLRDLYLPIPGHGSNRINAAYAWGGTPLLKQTLEGNFALKIDGCVEVDFEQFCGIIDHLDGVQLELRQDEADLINRETGSQLSSGSQTLDGAQALAYARIRKLDADGDFSRTDRQRKVIRAIVDSFRSAGMVKILTSVTEILPMLTTDLSTPELLGYAMEVIPKLSELKLQSQHIPAAGTYSDKTIDGMQVLVAEMDTLRRTLRDSLLPQ